MKHLLASCAVIGLLVSTAACSSESEDPETPPTPTAGVPEDKIAEHEAGPDSPAGFGIEIPDDIVQVGPLVRQETQALIPAADPTTGPALEPISETEPNDYSGGSSDEDSEEEAEEEAEETPGYTTALLRIDGEPGESIEELLDVLAEALPDAELEPSAWSDSCTVEKNTYTGCYYSVNGTTENDEILNVGVTVDPGHVDKSVASPGSLGRPVMTLTIEYLGQAEEGSGEEAEDEGSEDSESSDESGNAPEPAWPELKREQSSKPGNEILTPEWKVHPRSTVVLSGFDPGFALLSVAPGVDAEKIAQRYVRKFADPGTTPKEDEIVDRNQRSFTYRPRNDGSGPDVSATSISTGRGNYIELVYADPPTPMDGGNADKNDTGKDDADKNDTGKNKAGKGQDSKDKPKARRQANRTTSNTGNA